MTAKRMTPRQRQRRQSIHQFFEHFKCIECGTPASEMRCYDTPETFHLRDCSCGARYNVSAGSQRTPVTFEMFSEFQIGDHDWFVAYASAWNETNFLRVTGDGLREYDHKGYLSPRRFAKLFAFL